MCDWISLANKSKRKSQALENHDSFSNSIMKRKRLEDHVAQPQNFEDHACFFCAWTQTCHAKKQEPCFVCKFLRNASWGRRCNYSVTRSKIQATISQIAMGMTCANTQKNVLQDDDGFGEKGFIFPNCIYSSHSPLGARKAVFLIACAFEHHTQVLKDSVRSRNMLLAFRGLLHCTVEKMPGHPGSLENRQRYGVFFASKTFRKHKCHVDKVSY